MTSPPTTVGTYAVVAVYAGDANYLPAASSPVTFAISAAVVGQTLTLAGANFYLRLDPDGTDVDVWDGTTATGTPASTFPLAGEGSISIAGVASGTSVTVDFSAGDPLPAGGLAFLGVAGAANALTVIGTAGSDTVAVNGTTVTESAAFGSATVAYSNLAAITFAGGTGYDSLTQLAQPGGGATLTFAGTTAADALTVNAGTYTFAAAPAGSGVTPVTLGLLDIGAGSTVALAPAASVVDRHVLVLSNLTITGTVAAPQVRLDLGNNDLIGRNGTLAILTALVGDAYAGGTWAGQGIGSSAAAADPGRLHALGVILNSADGGVTPLYGSGTSLGLFDGQSPSAADVPADRTLLVTGGLTLAGSAGAWRSQLDLAGNDLIVRGGSLSQVTSEVAAGYAGGTWTGQGITSSTAAGDPTRLHALGVIVDDDGAGNRLYGNGAALGLFDGYDPAVGDVLVRYTFYGDANLDGKVDGADYARIDAGYLSRATATPLTGWYNGDFNGDGKVDASDYTLIDNAFNLQQAVRPAAAVLPAAVATPTAEVATSLRAPPAAASTSVPSRLVGRPFGPTFWSQVPIDREKPAAAAVAGPGRFVGAGEPPAGGRARRAALGVHGV